jgi:hypothetical protein
MFHDLKKANIADLSPEVNALCGEEVQRMQQCFATEYPRGE